MHTAGRGSKWSPSITCDIRRTLRQYSMQIRSIQREKEFVDRTVNFFRNRNICSIVQSRSAKIHSRIIAEFDCNMLGTAMCSCRREIGDILFVSKIFQKRNQKRKLIQQRAVIVQAKFSKKSNQWRIELGQLRLLDLWPRLTIFKPLQLRNALSSSPLNLRPKTRTWGSYILINPHWALFYSAKMIKQMLLRSHIPSMRHLYRCQRREVSLFISRPGAFASVVNFLARLIRGLIGENVLINRPIKTFVSRVYQCLGLQPDPPASEEQKNYDEVIPYEIDEERGFGIVEFRVFLGETERE